MPFDLPADYKQVPERIADLKAAHPDARLRPANPEKPFEVVTIGDKIFVVYAAACYRDADDQLPGIGVAWEPFPGRTPYTRDSELMNAETSAWGRAIVATLRSESKAIASAEDVRNRQADAAADVRHANPATGEIKGASDKQIGAIKSLGRQLDLSPDDLKVLIDSTLGRETKGWNDLTSREASKVIDALKANQSPAEGFGESEEPF